VGVWVREEHGRSGSVGKELRVGCVEILFTVDSEDLEAKEEIAV
jgi:hypothetical protein